MTIDERETILNHRFGRCHVRLVRADITALDVQAVVNPANGRMVMGAGVAAAIKRAGGPAVEQEARALAGSGVAVGDVVVTGGGSLPVRYVIHAVTVAGNFRSSAGAILLATKNALRRCADLGVEAVAFPALGTGVGGVPYVTAAEGMVQAIADHAEACNLPSLVTIALAADDALSAFEAALGGWIDKASAPF